MSYYYNNYVICNEDAKKKITSSHDDDFFDDLSGFYQDNTLNIDNNTYLVMFDTRGNECCSFIKKFVETYRSTIWYAIDEELAFQSRYFWNGDKVCRESRRLYDPNDKDQIRIEFSDDEERRPFLIYTITNKQIVVEDILNYRRVETNLQDVQSKAIEECLHSLTKDASNSSFDQYVIPNIKGIWLMANIHYNGCSIDINSLEKGESKKIYKYEDGQQKYSEIVTTINAIISNEQDGILIPPSNDALETIIRRFGEKANG